MLEKQRIWNRIDADRKAAITRGRAFFACPELGFHEEQTAARICAQLDEWQVSYENGVALTGVVTSIGRENGYHLAIVTDMDALPRQDGRGFIHSCGHSIQVADALTVLHALLPEARTGTLGGRVSFFFTPGEELTDPEYRQELLKSGTLAGRSGKQDMIAKGWFDDVDAVLSCHANGDQGRDFDLDSMLTGIMVKKAVFHGKAAHSGAVPYLGRNALHGAVLTENALAFLKDQFAPQDQVRIYPVLKNVSGGLSIIPDEAVLETYLRAAQCETLLDVADRFDTCARACGTALGLETTVTTMPGYLPLHQSAALNRAVEGNLRAFCSKIIRHPESGASGDIGDLGTLLPTVQFGFSGIDGVFHSDHFAIRDEEHCYVTVSKVLAGTVADILNQSKFQVRNPQFEEDKALYLKRWLSC